MDDITAVRTLIGDTESVNFTDDQITMFNSLALVSGPGAEYFYAASLALSSLAAKVGTTLQSVTIGDFQNSDGDRVTALQNQAEKFLEFYYNTPAFAVVEENLSQMNELIIIRNFILKNELL
jgi:hypothetical protein